MAFDRERIEALLALAGEQLEGEWLLAGGAAAAAWFAPGRTTEDVDIVGIGNTNAQRLALMELAERAAIPIEALNSTVDYFVRRVVDWREQLVVLHRGRRATIYRPNATLFVLLKIRRLSDVDLEDCLALIASGEPLERDRIDRALDEPTEDIALAGRRTRLRAALAHSR